MSRGFPVQDTGPMEAADEIERLRNDRRTTIEKCAKIAEEIGRITSDGDGELYIAAKIAAGIRALSPK